jgi:hypothetical protein
LTSSTIIGFRIFLLASILEFCVHCQWLKIETLVQNRRKR